MAIDEKMCVNFVAIILEINYVLYMIIFFIEDIPMYLKFNY
jgi:hypothetical protein